MGVLRWSVRIHKWVALIVGLQIMLWIAGGLVMSAIPIEQVRGEHKIAPTEALAANPADLLSLKQVTNRHQIDAISEAALGQMLSAPVWRLKSTAGETFVIDAMSGDRLNPVSETLARRIAEADYSGPGSLVTVLNIADPPSEYGRTGPVWRAEFDDGDATTLYIDPTTAEVRAR